MTSTTTHIFPLCNNSLRVYSKIYMMLCRTVFYDSGFHILNNILKLLFYRCFPCHTTSPSHHIYIFVFLLLAFCARSRRFVVHCCYYHFVSVFSPSVFISHAFPQGICCTCVCVRNKHNSFARRCSSLRSYFITHTFLLYIFAYKLLRPLNLFWLFSLALVAKNSGWIGCSYICECLGCQCASVW